MQYGGKPPHVEVPSELRRVPATGRDVRGAIPFQVGWVGKPACYNADRERVHEAKLKLQKQTEALKIQKQKEQIDALRLEFESHSGKGANVKARVESGLKALQHGLDCRRDRLKTLLLEEEEQLTREYVHKAQSAEEERAERIRKQVTAIRAEAAAKEKEVVELKRRQQYAQRLDQLRRLNSRRLAHESRDVQLYQMAQHDWLRAQAEEEERFWAEVMRKEVLTKMARDENDVREKKLKDLEIKHTLELQIQGKQKLREEEERHRQEQLIMNQKVLEELHMEEMKLLEEREQKQAQLAAELQEQIAIRQNVLENTRKQEKLIEDTFSKMTEETLRKEREAVMSFVEANAREQAMFRQNQEELRRLKEKEEEEIDRILQEEQEKHRKHQDQMRVALNEARQKLMKNVLEGRDRQVENRRRLKELEAQQLEAEKKLSEEIRLAHKALDEEHKRRRAQKQRQYAEDLKKQAEFARRLKELEESETDRRWRQAQIEDEQYTQLLENLMQRGDDPAYPPHPFMVPLKCPEAMISPKLADEPTKDESGGNDKSGRKVTFAECPCK